VARIHISGDDYEEAKDVLNDPVPTGRMRWWRGLGEQATLQSEWKSRDGLSRIWVAIPMLTEMVD